MAHSHCTGPGQGEGTRKRWVSILCYVPYTLHRDRDRNREPLFSIVPILGPVPVPVPVPVPCSVNEPLESFYLQIDNTHFPLNSFRGNSNISHPCKLHTERNVLQASEERNFSSLQSEVCFSLQLSCIV